MGEKHSGKLNYEHLSNNAQICFLLLSRIIFSRGAYSANEHHFFIQNKSWNIFHTTMKSK
jgi:hypothetical protein